MVKSLPFVTALTALSFSFLPAQAAIISYDFNVTPDSGPLDGNSYNGSFSYDDSSLTGTGEEFLPQSAITAINFEFEGTTYTLADALSAGVQFLDGNFLGLAYVTDAAFSFEPGLTSLSEAYFSYEIASGAGFGDVSYSLQSSGETVPEPTGLLALAGLAVTGLVRRLKTSS